MRDRRADLTAGCHVSTRESLATKLCACFKESCLRGLAQLVRFTAVFGLLFTAAAKTYTLTSGTHLRFSLQGPVLFYLSERQVLTLAVLSAGLSVVTVAWLVVSALLFMPLWEARRKEGM